MQDKKTMFNTLAILGGILLVLGMGLSYYKQHVSSSERNTAATQTLLVSDQTPYIDLEGNPFSFDQFRGQVRVVNAWASWSPFCVTELTNLETLANEYADQNVAVIGVNRKEPKEKAQAFLGHIGSFSKTHFAIDLTDAFYTSIGGFSMPETIFYDTKGNIVFHARGAMTLDQMREHTKAALAESDT